MVASKAEIAKRVRAYSGVEWLSLDQACTYVGVAPNAFRANVRPHVLCKTLGRRVLVNVASLDQFMAGLPSAQKKSRPGGRPHCQDGEEA